MYIWSTRNSSKYHISKLLISKTIYGTIRITVISVVHIKVLGGQLPQRSIKREVEQIPCVVLQVRGKEIIDASCK